MYTMVISKWCIRMYWYQNNPFQCPKPIATSGEHTFCHITMVQIYFFNNRN